MNEIQRRSGSRYDGSSFEKMPKATPGLRIWVMEKKPSMTVNLLSKSIVWSIVVLAHQLTRNTPMIIRIGINRVLWPLNEPTDAFSLTDKESR